MGFGTMMVRGLSCESRLLCDVSTGAAYASDERAGMAD